MLRCPGLEVPVKIKKIPQPLRQAISKTPTYKMTGVRAFGSNYIYILYNPDSEKCTQGGLGRRKKRKTRKMGKEKNKEPCGDDTKEPRAFLISKIP